MYNSRRVSSADFNVNGNLSMTVSGVDTKIDSVRKASLRKYHVVQGVCNLASNIIVLVSVCKFEYLRTRGNAFIISNTVLNLFLGFLEIFYGLHYFDKVQQFSDIYSAVCYGMYYTIYSAFLCSWIHTLFMSIDRFLSVVVVFWYLRNVTLLRTLIIVGFVWIFAFLAGLLLIIFDADPLDKFQCVLCIVPRAFRIYVVVPTLLFIFLFVNVVYIILGVMAHRHRSKIMKQRNMFTAGTSQDGHPSDSFKVQLSARLQKFKGLKMNAAIIFMLLFCWLPYSLMEIVYANECVGNSYHTAAFLLGFSSCIVNVLVYPLCTRPFRAGMRDIILCRTQYLGRVYSHSVSTCSAFSKSRHEERRISSESLMTPTSSFLTVPTSNKSYKSTRLPRAVSETKIVMSKDVIIVAEDWESNLEDSRSYLSSPVSKGTDLAMLREYQDEMRFQLPQFSGALSLSCPPYIERRKDSSESTLTCETLTETATADIDIARSSFHSLLNHSEPPESNQTCKTENGTHQPSMTSVLTTEPSVNDKTESIAPDAGMQPTERNKTKTKQPKEKRQNGSTLEETRIN